MSGKTASTDGKQKPWLFQPGQSGNPAGRTKGSRNKLQEDFLKDVLEAWETSGADAIKLMIADKPGDFVKMVAGLMPKEATLNVNTAEEMSDAELAERIRQLGSAIAPFLVGGIGNADEGAEGAAVAQLASRVH